MPYIILPSEIHDFTKFELPEEIPKIDLMYLFTIMFHPRNNIARERLERAFDARNASDWIRQFQKDFGKTHEIVVDADLALWLAGAPNLDKELSDVLEVARFRGAVSAFILGWVIFRRAGLHSALRAVEQACIKGGRRGGMLYNLRRNIWPSYSPAAHLWAAYQLWQGLVQGKAVLATHAGLRLFLMMAEWFRCQAESRIPPRATAPIVDANETWKVRAEISAEWPPINIECENLDVEGALLESIRPRSDAGGVRLIGESA